MPKMKRKGDLGFIERFIAQNKAISFDRNREPPQERGEGSAEVHGGIRRTGFCEFFKEKGVPKGHINLLFLFLTVHGK